MANIKKKQTLPLIPIRGIVVFPFMMLHFDVARKKSVAALEAAMEGQKNVFLTAQKDVTVEDPTASDIYTLGTVSRVKQMLKLPGGGVRVLVEGLYRAEISGKVQEEPYFECETTEVRSMARGMTPLEEEAALRMLNELIDEYFSLNPKLSPDSFKSVLSLEDTGRFTDAVASNFLMKVEDKQAVLEELRVLDRATLLVSIMTREIELARTENDILAKVKSQIDQNQREYFLREQMKAISQELDGDIDEIDEYAEKIQKSALPQEVLEKAERELKRLEKTPSNSPESTVIRNWLDWILDLPFGIFTEENTSLKSAEKVLEADHYGLKKVKERILEYLSVKILSGSLSGQIICLAGPPGVGKTSVARSIASALGRKYARISLGGVRDEAEIRGHRKTYIGSMPGRIISALKQAGSSNALILLDEIDKLSSDIKGDPASALLEVLDPEQNFSFRDHYLEVPFDLSQTLFITTANNAENIPPALYDRMEIINIPGYTTEEKEAIAIRHLLPKNLAKHGLLAAQLEITRAAITNIILCYTREAGVRTLDREIAHICRRAAGKILCGEEKVSINTKNLPDFLGVLKYKKEKRSIDEEIGIVRGLAWTSVGGDTLSIEVNVMEGTGKTELTGQLGDVMKESARAAISYIRSRARSLGIDPSFYKTTDIHLHVPEGAVPKDGPSAGITIATAMVSALTGRYVRGDIAMTGEITIRGRVLPIGGLCEKALAAYRFGIKTIIIPEDNKKDLAEIPAKIRAALNIIPVSDMDSVLKIALGEKAAVPHHASLDAQFEITGEFESAGARAMLTRQ